MTELPIGEPTGSCPIASAAPDHASGAAEAGPARVGATTVAPGAWPLLGHLPQLRRDPLGFLCSLPRLGDLVAVRLGPSTAYVLCDQDLVHRMFRTPAVFDKGGIVFDKARQLVANGLITSMWPDHQRQRPLIQPAFGRAQLETYTQVMREEVAALSGSWRPGETVAVKPMMDALIARITARTLFQSDLGAAAVTVIQETLPILVDGLYRRMIMPLGLLEKLPTPANRRYRDASARLHAVIDDVIDGYRGSGVHHSDVLSMVLAAHEGDDQFTDAEVHDQIFSILAAGTETTATVLSWTLHLLGQNPQAQQRMHAEIDDVLQGAPPTFHDIPRLEYTRRVITEAMRLYPPTWLLTRTATVDTHLGNHAIPAGSTLVFSPYMLHRDPALFPHPDRFDPDRWAPERLQREQQHALVPFGGGARKCIGDVFSMTESVIILAGISAQWSLVSAPGTPTRPVPKAFLTPDPLSMTILARSDSAPRPEGQVRP